MAKKQYRKLEREPSHAGRILKSGFLDVYELRVETVAGLLGMSRVHFSRILNGHSPVTPDLAIRLEILTKTPASQWLAIQAKYDAYQLEQQQGFITYKEVVNQWATNALPLQPDIRRQDDRTRQLTIEASALAKQLGSRKGVVKVAG